MHLSKNRTFTLLCTLLLCSTLSAADVEGVVELKYGIANGKATSYVDTASDTTQAPSFSFGAKQKNYNTRTLINYKPIRWRDADANLLSLSFDYIYELESSVELFGGVGIGTLEYKAKDMSAQELVYTAQIGANYTLVENFYLTANLNYLYTNGIRIEKNQYIYSELENMLGVEVGVGVLW